MRKGSSSTSHQQNGRCTPKGGRTVPNASKLPTAAEESGKKKDHPSRQLVPAMELFGTKVRCEDISGLLLSFKPALISDDARLDTVK